VNVLDYEAADVHAARRRRAAGVGMLVLASALWSLSGVAVKLVQIPAFPFAFYRSTGAAAAMALVAPFLPGRRPRAGWMALSALVYTGVVTLLILAMTAGKASTGILLQYTAPVWCALLAWLFQRRRIGGVTLVAIAVATVGIIVMIAGQPRGTNLVVPVAGIVSGIAFGALALLLEKLDRVSGGAVSSTQIVLFNNLGAAVVLLCICAATHTLALPAWKIGVVLGVGVIQLALPYVLFQQALRRVTPVDASLLTLLEPVLNPVWVALVTPERPDVATYVGGAAILVALVIEATKKPATS
jgi:drug/metabolite transporter (DMT)-like permease